MSSEPDEIRAKPQLLRSIIAGCTAGAVEIAITYPAECNRKDKITIEPSAARVTKITLAFLWQGVVRWLYDLDYWQLDQSWYSYVASRKETFQASLNVRIGFVAFDSYKSLLQDEAGKLSGPRTVIAGFGAGITESLLAVTPFESIKTQLIDDRKSANPRMRGFLHGSKVIAQEKGFRGFFQGFVPTTARQAANSAVRFGSYTTLKQMAESYVAPGEKLGTMSTFALGGMAGFITV
ncbi:MAG: hypothetical protein Q9227_001932 [Pyrenula ochraceoflavens]